MPFTIKRTESTTEVLLKISGSLDESGSLPQELYSNLLRLDLSDLQGISSIGIRNFIFWGDKHLKVKSIRLEKCPFVFVKSFSMIAGFLKPNMTLMSFYVSYHCPETNEQKEVLFERNKEFTGNGSFHLPQVKSSTGTKMEIDVDLKTFFSFLKR